MKREIITTADGSVTIYLPEMMETYHSKFGAIQEARHVFIDNGFTTVAANPVSVLEIGFGTGLNAFITYLEAVKQNRRVYYTGVEAYPVAEGEVSLLNYVAQLDAAQHERIFRHMHASVWEEKAALTDNFTLIKRKQDFSEINDTAAFDLIYFDAFGYQFQPELWSAEIFKKMYNALKPNGVLLTYACRTVIKKAMQEAGFSTKKLPGSPGKREMLKAFKS